MYNYCLTGVQLNNKECSNPIDLLPNNIEGFESTIKNSLDKYYLMNIENFESDSDIVKNTSGLIGWYDSIDPNLTGTVPPNDTEIKTWKDKSNSKNDLVAKIPGKWSNKSIKFSSSWYQSIKPSSYPIDVYLVVKLDKLNVQNDVVSLTEINSDNFNSLTYSEYKSGFWHNGSSNFHRTDNAVAKEPESKTDFLIMGWSLGNNNFKIYRNNVEIMSTNSYTWTTNNPYLQLGNRASFSADSLLNGSISEVVVYNRQLESSERNKIFDYLNSRWILSSPNINTSVPTPAPAPAPTPAPASTSTPTPAPASTSTPTSVPASTSTPTSVPASTSTPAPAPALLVSGSKPTPDSEKSNSNLYLFIGVSFIIFVILIFIFMRRNNRDDNDD